MSEPLPVDNDATSSQIPAGKVNEYHSDVSVNKITDGVAKIGTEAPVNTTKLTFEDIASLRRKIDSTTITPANAFYSMRIDRTFITNLIPSSLFAWFAYWRCDLRITFEIIPPTSMTGFAVTWFDPLPEALQNSLGSIPETSGLTLYDQLIHSIHPLSGAHKTIVDIPWTLIQPYLYRESGRFDQTLHDIGRLTYRIISPRFGTGTVNSSTLNVYIELVNLSTQFIRP